MSNESKGLIAGFAFIAAVIIVIVCQVYHTVHGQTLPKACQGNDPRIIAPYHLSECKTDLFLFSCYADRIGKNYRARARFDNKCIKPLTEGTSNVKN